MKRHFNALLQRKRIEFEGADDTRKRSGYDVKVGTAKLQVKDGYDWLQQIQHTQSHRVAAR